MTTEVILRELPDPRGSGRPLTPPLDLSVTTQGPLYPPSEVMDAQGNFIVIGALNEEGPAGVTTRWGGAIVSPRTSVPQFGQRAPYTIVERFEPKEPLPDAVATKVLYTLPVPLPCNNYTMLFAPQQYPDDCLGCGRRGQHHRHAGAGGLRMTAVLHPWWSGFGQTCCA